MFFNWRNGIKLTLVIHAFGLLMVQPSLAEEAIVHSLEPSRSTLPANPSTSAPTDPSATPASNRTPADPGSSQNAPSQATATPSPEGITQASDAPTCYWYASGYCRCF